MVRRVALFAVVFAVALGGIGVGGALATAPKKEVLHASNMHAYPAKGNANPFKPSVSLLAYHGGSVQHGTSVHPIFWGSTWDPGVGDKITGLVTFYGGVGGSPYAKTNIEYSDSSGTVSPSVTYHPYGLDSTSAPSRAPQTSAVLAEVAKVTNGAPEPGAYYPVYVDAKRGHAGYCAWHSAGSINGISVEFGFFFNLDGDSGCDPQDPGTIHSQGLEALANVTGHELSETLTDPNLSAWYDSSGAENADKCAWKFSGTSVTIGGQPWRVQGNWSNNAYNAGQGYVRGCIDHA